MNLLEDRDIQTLIFTLIFGVFGLYHLLIFLVIKHKILLYFSVLIIGLCAHWSLYLFIDKSVPIQNSSFPQRISLITAMITIIGMLLFTKSYLNIKKTKYKILDSVYTNLIIIALSICALHLINWSFFEVEIIQKALSVIAALLALGAIVINLYSGISLINKNRLNKYYLYASWPMLVAASLYISGWLLMNRFDIDKANLILITSILVVLQLVLFSVIIGFKFKLIEERNLKLQLDVNEELQVEVASRTKELEIAKKALEIKNTDLERINALKNKLFSLLTHDVRTPLQNFESIIDLVGSDLENDVKIELSNELKVEISEKLKMVNGLLQWSYKQLDGVEINKEICVLEEVFKNAKIEFIRMANEKNVEIIIDSDSSSVFIDRNMFRVILRNLVSNAIKFSPKNSTVTLWSLSTVGGIEIGIQDSGEGMKTDWFQELSSKKLPITTLGTGGEKGTGFGLMITKDFVEMNGGRMEIESNPNQGTTVKLLFPNNEIS